MLVLQQSWVEMHRTGRRRRRRPAAAGSGLVPHRTRQGTTVYNSNVGEDGSQPDGLDLRGPVEQHEDPVYNRHSRADPRGGRRPGYIPKEQLFHGPAAQYGIFINTRNLTTMGKAVRVERVMGGSGLGRWLGRMRRARAAFRVERVMGCDQKPRDSNQHRTGPGPRQKGSKPSPGSTIPCRFVAPDRRWPCIDRWPELGLRCQEKLGGEAGSPAGRTPPPQVLPMSGTPIRARQGSPKVQKEKRREARQKQA